MVNKRKRVCKFASSTVHLSSTTHLSSCYSKTICTVEQWGKLSEQTEVFLSEKIAKSQKHLGWKGPLEIIRFDCLGWLDGE